MVMDIGDPFSLKNNAFENNRYLYKSLNYYFENKFYKKADQVVFTHQESANEHKKFFNISEKKLQSGTLLALLVRVIPKINLFNYETKPIMIGYFGVLTKGVRSPEEVLKFLAKQSLNFTGIQIQIQEK